MILCLCVLQVTCCCYLVFPVSALCSILICIEHECVRLTRSKETLCSIRRHTVVMYMFLSLARDQPIYLILVSIKVRGG
jgi:hypothetical protein